MSKYLQKLRFYGYQLGYGYDFERPVPIKIKPVHEEGLLSAVPVTVKSTSDVLSSLNPEKNQSIVIAYKSGGRRPLFYAIRLQTREGEEFLRRVKENIDHEEEYMRLVTFYLEKEKLHTIIPSDPDVYQADVMNIENVISDNRRIYVYLTYPSKEV